MFANSTINKNRVAEEAAIVMLVNRGYNVGREVKDKKRYMRIGEHLCYIRSHSVGPFPCGRADNSAVGGRFEQGDFVLWVCVEQGTCKLWQVSENWTWREVW